MLESDRVKRQLFYFGLILLFIVIKNDHAHCVTLIMAFFLFCVGTMMKKQIIVGRCELPIGSLKAGLHS